LVSVFNYPVVSNYADPTFLGLEGESFEILNGGEFFGASAIVADNLSHVVPHVSGRGGDACDSADDCQNDKRDDQAVFNDRRTFSIRH
jgi:hypothetical protein